MLFVLLVSSVYAFDIPVFHDEPLVPVAIELREPPLAWLGEQPELLHGTAVIDLHAAPPVMPAPAAALPTEHDVRTVEDRRAVAAEALARE